jgi:hypothetical protein
LLKETREKEKERLLLKVLPEQHMELLGERVVHEGESYLIDTSGQRKGLRICFRMLFEEAAPETQQKVVTTYAELIKKPARQEREAYENAFFMAKDMKHVGPEHQLLILDHLLARLAEDMPSIPCELYHGIGGFLTESNWRKLFDPLLAYIMRHEQDDDVRSLLTREIHEEMSTAIRSLAIDDLVQRRDMFNTMNRQAKAELLRLVIEGIPF